MSDQGMNELKQVLDGIAAVVGPVPAGDVQGPEEQGRADAARVARERAERISQLLPKAFRWAIVGTPDLRRAVACGGVLEELVSKMRCAERVVLTGGAGTGKTSLAVAALRAHLESARKGLFVPAFRLASARARSPLGKESPEVVAALEVELLVLDELGSEPMTATSAVADVIYERHLAGSRTWITTPFDDEQIARRYGDGIARRIFERTLHVELGKR